MCIQIIQHFVSKIGVLDSFLSFSRECVISFGYFRIFQQIAAFSTVFVKTPCLKKNPVTPFLAILCPNQVFLAIFCHFLQNGSYVLAYISYLDGLEHSLHFLLRPHGRKKIRSPCFGPFCVQNMRFLCHFQIALFWEGLYCMDPFLYQSEVLPQVFHPYINCIVKIFQF